MPKLAPLENRSLPSLNGFTRRDVDDERVDRKRVFAAAGSVSQVQTGSGDHVVLAGQGNELVNFDQLLFFDYNMHALKKGLSSALLDVALLMANVSQLKSVYLIGHIHPFYTVLLVLLSLSIILQVLSAILIIFLGKININMPDAGKHKQAVIMADIVLVSIFLLTIINIIISSLGISDGVPQSDRFQRSDSHGDNGTNG